MPSLISNQFYLREFLTAGGILLAATAGWLVWNQSDDGEVVPPPDHAEVLMVWPDTAKDKQLSVGKEYDTTKPTAELIAGKRVQRITNVGKAELHFWPAPKEKNTGTSVVICPGGGFWILAWDLEGTEIAQWLNSIGVNAFILKYRVPTAKHDLPSAAGTEDLQRTIALIRHNAKKWNLKKDQVGALGFSAGGAIVVATGLATERYKAVDKVDDQNVRPNFIVPVYGALMVADDGVRLREGMALDENSPPAFLVHAQDDFVPVRNALELSKLYKEANVRVECHVFDSGGHGFGARFIEDSPVTGWPKLCEQWMRRNGWLEQIAAETAADESKR